MSEQDIYKGTTTVGIICKDGLILATDSRATMGSFIASSAAKKVYRIGERLAMTIAGSVGDAQQLVKMMSIETKMYKVSREHSMSVKAATNMLAGVLRQNRMYPFSVQILLGGYDASGTSLYSIDMAGGLIEEEYFISTGSGSPIALGVLESQYKINMDMGEGLILAVKALKTAMKRDSASGSTLQVVRITKEQFDVVDSDEIDFLISEMI